MANQLLWWGGNLRPQWQWYGAQVGWEFLESVSRTKLSYKASHILTLSSYTSTHLYVVIVRCLIKHRWIHDFLGCWTLSASNLKMEAARSSRNVCIQPQHYMTQQPIRDVLVLQGHLKAHVQNCGTVDWRQIDLSQYCRKSTIIPYGQTKLALPRTVAGR